MDLSQLSPEEIAELKAALAEPPEDPIKVLASAMELLMAQVEAIEGKVDGVCKVVYDDFIGGIKDLASEKARSDRIGGLKDKYGGLFAPHNAYIADHLSGDADGIYPLLADRLDELKGEQGDAFTEEVGDTEIQRIAKEIADRVAAVTGKSTVVEASKPPEPPKEEGAGKALSPKEEEKKEEPKEAPKEEDPMEKVKKHIGSLKERSGQAA